ncbi:predicted protein [Histoplasma mississippiense (nom. inval.)]|uniref:predicted protein n=1 Tax=Ajellomyces capsulatus (strain NAm1 / WU24) TaxID=2059318 RepID=UPI000157C9AF|nr:predicted protein [Histoplasma mississippiense (nom. inval.)]EDN09688.1 predicted protein [Histoplasma mississippiense (nom. inval.)]
MEFTDVKVAEIMFQKQLAKRDYSVIFLVTVLRTMKVVAPWPWDSKIRETNLFICEATAYRRLTHAGKYGFVNGVFDKTSQGGIIKRVRKNQV